MEIPIRAICKKEGLPCREVSLLHGGQVNQVFGVDGRYVVRIGAREDAYARLRQETDLLKRFDGQIPVPHIYAFGQHEEWTYQIQRYMHGQRLMQVWKGYAAATQDTIAAQIAAALRVVHATSAPAYGYRREGSPTFTSWPDFLSDKFERTLREYQALGIRTMPGYLETAADYFNQHRHVLEGGEATLVHSDLTMTNLLAHMGNLSAILDFEYALYAPRDYELWAMEAFCLYPNDYAEEDDEVYTSADFASFLPLLQKHEPNLFAIPNLRERINLYHLDATLSSHLSWRKDNLAKISPDKMAAKEFYMARITNFTFRHGVRMF